ncbi:MAG: DNA mismatch endonuclease Vsr [Eggerthellaceae bacterium]|nr:DNA mismatch endonuclease Vsr [Eggerthellaceae bacterium]
MAKTCKASTSNNKTKRSAPLAPKAPPAPPASSDAVRASMQGNKGADTKPELLVRQRLREAGLTGYRLHWKVPGRPDVAWPGKKVALFVNGCFWHRHKGCKMASTPKSTREYWTFKFERNVERDKQNMAALRRAGWRIHIIWECQLKKDRIESTFARLLPKLAGELDKELHLPSSAKERAT